MATGPRNNFQRGFAFERLVKRLFEKNGYMVIRSAGSQGPIDLVALKNGLVYLVQCKLKRRIEAHTVEALLTVAGSSPYLIPVYAYGGKKIRLVNIRTRNEIRL